MHWMKKSLFALAAFLVPGAVIFAVLVIAPALSNAGPHVPMAVVAVLAGLAYAALVWRSL